MCSCPHVSGILCRVWDTRLNTFHRLRLRLREDFICVALTMRLIKPLPGYEWWRLRSRVCVCVMVNCEVWRSAIGLYYLQLRVQCISAINTYNHPIQPSSNSRTPKTRDNINKFSTINSVCTLPHLIWVDFNNKNLKLDAHGPTGRT
jgi:hypothetical protein